MTPETEIARLKDALHRIATLSSENPGARIPGVSPHESCWQTARLIAREALGITE